MAQCSRCTCLLPPYRQSDLESWLWTPLENGCGEHGLQWLGRSFGTAAAEVECALGLRVNKDQLKRRVVWANRKPGAIPIGAVLGIVFGVKYPE